MEIFIQESLYVLDYDNNTMGILYKSDDRDTQGYAFDVRIEEANTGYSNLSFSMPTSVFENGEAKNNPKLSGIGALTKIRYERTMTYTGEEPIVLVEPVNNFEGESAEIEYNKGDIIEHYVMDYIIQPSEQKRQGLQIDNSFTAIDYPRHVLSKKKAGLVINENVVTTPDISIWNNKPIDVPGSVKYIEWTDELNTLIGRPAGALLGWDPKTLKYPLTEAEIQILLDAPGIWDYGVLATTFYWEVTDSARLEGILYEEGNFIGLNIYNTLLKGYTLSSEEYTPLLDKLAVNWLQINAPDVFLGPNNALGYLKYLLNNTGWEIDSIKSSSYIGEEGVPFLSLGELTSYVSAHSIDLDNDNYSVVGQAVYKWQDTQWKDVSTEPFGKRVEKETGFFYNVDIEQEAVYLPDMAEQGIVELTDKTCLLEINDSNCYNAITTLGTQLQLYPLFNCAKKTVALKARPGKDHGLGYQFGVNIKNNSVSLDGDKIITKLFVSGGADANGSTNINIGTANRATEGEKVYPTGNGIFSWVDTPSGHHTVLCPIDYIVSTEDQEYAAGVYYFENNVYKYCVETNPLSFVTLTPTNNVQFEIPGQPSPYVVKDYQGENITVEKWFNDLRARVIEYKNGIVQEVADFNPNDAAYLEARSPAGTNYIFNFKYLYDKEYMSREQIVDIYKHSTQIGVLQKRYITRYSQDYIKTSEAYLNAINNEEMNIVNWQSSLNAMMNIYYVNPSTPSSGTFYAFADKPVDAKEGSQWKSEYPGENLEDLDDHDFYVRIYDGSTVYGYVRTPVFPDGNDNAGDRRYSPKQKGFALQTIEQLSFDDFKYGWPALRGLTPAEITTILPTVANTDPSGTVSNYNAYAAKFINYYKTAYNAHDDIVLALQNIEDIELIRIEYEEKTNEIEQYLQENYGDYIIEGFYRNENQPYVNFLFNEATEASEKFAYPDVTYNLNVIDSSGLFEYRNRSNDTFNDLVHYLHSVGQIVPRAGDEVTIVDSALGMLNVPGMITTITRNLDDPMENNIVIDTGFTDEEELVGNIIQATNTVLNNTDIYARTAMLNKDGTINANSLISSLNTPNASLTLVGSDGTSLFDSSGVLVSDSSNNDNKLKITNGNLLTSSDGGNNWDEVITPQGLNINHATIGTIDTTKVSIMDGNSKKVILNSNGLVVKNDPDRGYEIGGNWDNVKAFIGVDNSSNKNGQVFVDGMIRATQGSEIAGWSIGQDKIYKEVTQAGNQSYTSLSSDSSDYAIAAGTSSAPEDYKFTVTHDGDVTIGGGDIVLDSNGLQIKGDTGYILNSNGIYTNLNFLSTANYDAFATSYNYAGGMGHYGSYGCLGMLVEATEWGDASSGEYASLFIYADIPNNFVVTDARIYLYHFPGRYIYNDVWKTDNPYQDWGYAQNVKLFKSDFPATNQQYFAYFVADSGEWDFSHPVIHSPKSLVPGYTWSSSGTDSFTAATPSGNPITAPQAINAPYQEVYTSNIASSITPGKTNVFVIQSIEDIPTLVPSGQSAKFVQETYTGTVSSTEITEPIRWCALRSGYAMANLSIRGYYRP